MHKSNFHKNQRGMALIIALLLLLLVSAVGLGMIYMSSTETEINANYKDSQSAFFAMRGGLEEMRERMRTQSLSYIGTVTATPMPTIQMPGTAGSIFYITNPSAGEVVTPLTVGSTYFDDEFCHEWFTLLAANYKAPGTTCGAGGAAPATSVTTVASNAPYTGTASSLPYKWIRLTLKQNGTFPNAVVDSTQAAASQVCWNSSNSQEVVATALGYPDCTTAANAGLMVEPLYLVTSLAITPQGSRRVGQYEAAALDITPPPGALALDGPAAQFSPAPHSNNYFASGTNSGAAAYTGPGACPVTTPAIAPAISTGDQAGVNNLVGVPPGSGTIPSNRLGNYTGTAPPPPALATPSIMNQGATGTNPTLTGTWASPAALNNLAASIGDGADQTLSCGIGAPCSFPATGLGTDASPMITYVNGDFNMGSNSGAGVLVVTGTLTITGNASFDGLILVIGQGVIQENGGGNGQFNGSIFLATTNSSVSPYAQLATLGSPLIAWNGGGTNGIQYNSCWANIGNNMHYLVVASREEMY
jgi:hypothetical protein